MAALLGLVAALGVLRAELVVRTPLMAVAFDHQDHGAVRCATCHHNFFDDTGTDSCYFCHKRERDLALTIEHDFHTFCRDCHVRIARLGKDSGPLRRCDGCHAEPAFQPAPLVAGARAP